MRRCPCLPLPDPWPSAILVAMAELLSVRDLRILFPSAGGLLPVVDGVSFDVPKGGCVALVGESGSGKTLSALAILRLIPEPGVLSGGQIILRGRDLLSLSEEQMRQVRGQEAAMIFQEPQSALNPVLTIGYQVAEGVLAHESVSRKAAMDRAVELLDLVGLSDPRRRLHEYPHQFSGGMRQRAMIAMALACRPALLIADEPTTALDVTVQAQILDLLTQLRETFSMAVLLITHDLGVVARFAERVTIMYAGRVMEEADVVALFRRPGHPYTRGLLQSLPSLEKKTRRLEAIPGTVPSPAAMPAGCPFEPRCAFAREACGQAVPELAARGDGRRVRCILEEDSLP
jgi:peptide/nickel transport system ATP-binding protein